MIKFLRFLKNRTKTFKKTSRAVKKTWSTATEEKLFRWQHIFHQKSRRSKGNGTKFATWWKKTVNPEFYIYKIYCSGIKIRKTFLDEGKLGRLVAIRYTLKEELMVAWGRRGGIFRDFGMNINTLLYLKWITNKDILYSTWTSAHCYMEAWMGGEFGGESVHAVTQLCLTVCDPMDCSTPGLPVHHQFSELAQTHVHQVGDAIKPSHPMYAPFSSCPQSLPASGSFPMSQFFTSGGQSIGASASASVLPMNIQDWYPLGLTGLIFLQFKRFSRVFSNTTVQKHQFFSAQLLRVQLSHPYMTSGGEWIYVYVWLSPFAVHLKLSHIVNWLYPNAK